MTLAWRRGMRCSGKLQSDDYNLSLCSSLSYSIVLVMSEMSIDLSENITSCLRLTDTVSWSLIQSYHEIHKNAFRFIVRDFLY